MSENANPEVEGSGCPHCPDGHDDPAIKPWGVYVAADRDGDGQPLRLTVQPSDGSHVADSDAEWLRQLINDEAVLRANTRRQSADHPPHHTFTGEFGEVARPLEASDLLLRWRLRRACRRRGGHWWHPLPGGLIDWFCCVCGVLTDGMPRDGARR